MGKLAVILIATLLLQGVAGAAIGYDDDFTFINLWNEIELEIQNVVLRLKSEDDWYEKTLVDQCKKLANVIEGVVNQLHQETIDHEQGDIIFKRVINIFQDVLASLNRMSTSSTSKLIFYLETVMEHMEQLVFIAKTYCPQLRALLRTILVDFLDFVRGFRTTNGILEKDVVIYENPTRMVGQIHEITKQFTDLLKECNHMEEMRMALRGYVRYVEEIIHKLEDYDHVVLKRLTDELRMMFVPLMKMSLREEHVDVGTFKTELIKRFFSINAVFDQLLDLINNDECSTEIRNFIERIIYFYYYSIKQTHFEVRTAYKNSFYGSNYHEEFFKEGDDLKELLNVVDTENGIETPEELMLGIQKLVQRFNNKNWDSKPLSYYTRSFVQVVEYVADKIAKEVRVHRLAYAEDVMNGFYTNLKTIKTELEGMLSKDAVDKAELVRRVRKMFVDLYKIVMVEKTQDDGYEHLLLKDICIKFKNFLENVFYNAEVYEQQGVEKENRQVRERRNPKFVLIKIIKY